MQLNDEMQLGKSVVMWFIGRESPSPWPGSSPVESVCFHSIMNALIALSLVLFFVGNEKLIRECVETLRSFAGIDAKVAVLKLFTY